MTKYTVADIKLETTVPYSSIMDMNISSEQGMHSILSITMETSDSLKAGDTERYLDSEISVRIADCGIVFAGICKKVSLINRTDYKTIQITAYTTSIKMDQDKKKKTFQDPSKTLQKVADEVAGSYGATVILDADIPMPNVLSQDNETDWEFLKRIAASMEKTTYVDTASNAIRIFIGKLGFRSFGEDILCESEEVARNVGEMVKAQQNGKNAEGFMFDEGTCECKNASATAGDKVGDAIVIRKGQISLVQGVIYNKITHAFEEGIRPTTAESSEPALKNSVLTGTVMSVNKNQIQVQLHTDGGPGGMVWLPYESYISNSFYCMPDEGDTVFLYYENNGTIVCLGSKHVNTDQPDFDKPKEDVLTNHDKMIKLGEKHVCFTTTRALHDQQDSNEISITMEDGVGITINSGRDIVVNTTESMNLLTGNVEGMDQDYIDAKAKLEERHTSGNTAYVNDGGEHGFGELLGEAGMDFLKTQGQNLLDMGKGMVMYDLWSGLITGGDEPQEEPEDPPLETGVATLYGYESLVLTTGKSTLAINTQIEINTETFKWLGYTQQEHEAQERPLQDWWETILDGVQFALDIAGCFPVLGAIPDLINAGISLARGNFAEAALSLVSAIPVAGDAVGAAKIAGKAAKTVVKAMTKSEKIIAILRGLYMVAQGAYSLYMMRDQIADLWDKIKKGENIFTPGDISLMFNMANATVTMGRGAVSIGQGVRGTKKVAYEGDDAKNGDNNSNDGNDPTDTSKTKADNNTNCGDPINIVTGSFSLKYTDFQLRDVLHTFFLTRNYESVYENKGMMLGCKWFLNIESRLGKTSDGIMHVQLMDMSLLEFKETEDGWVNCKSGDMTYQLYTIENGYLLKDHHKKQTLEYDVRGKLISITDQYHIGTQFHYDEELLSRIQFASGQTLSFTYNKNLLECITSQDGRKIHYEYEGDLLTKATLPNNGSILYDYDANGNIHTITDQNGNTYVKNEYDRKGRVVKQTTSEGCEFVFYYDTVNHQTIFTEQFSGEREIYTYNNQQVVTQVEYGDGTTEVYGYDEWENKNYRKDRNGYEIFKTFDVFGQLIEERLPSGLITNYEYDINHNKVRQTDNMGSEICWIYNEKNQLIKETMKLDQNNICVMEFKHDSMGRITEYVNPNGNIVEYDYENFSEPIMKRNPEGETWFYEYDMAGRCLRERSQRGTIDYGYNRTDCTTMIKDPDGNITRYYYDLLGNQTGILKPQQNITNGSKIEISYNALDKIHRIITAEGSVYKYRYGTDAKLQKEVHPNAFDWKNENGEGDTFEYDITGRMIRTHHPDGGCERIFYDGNGNVIKKVLPAQYDKAKDDGPGYTYTYDSADRLTQITNPYGQVEQVYIYDVVGNIVKSIDALGYQTGDTDENRAGTLYTYNLAGWLTSKRIPIETSEEEIRYRLNTYTYDNMGNLLSEKRYLDLQSKNSCKGHTHVIRYAYDKSNHLIRVEDTTGAAIFYTYDSDGNRTSEKLRLSEDVYRETHYVYSAGGNLLKRMVKLDSSDGRESDFAITEYTYDANGNLTKQKFPEGGVCTFRYDADDRLIKECHLEENGEIRNEVNYAYDAASNRISVTDIDGHKYEYFYDLQDRETGSLLPDGGRTKTVYDKNGNAVQRYSPLQMAEFTKLSLTNIYDNNIIEGDINQKSDSSIAGWHYEFDMCNRLSQILSPDGMIRNQFKYDNAGNVLKQVDGSGSGIHLSYDLAGRRISAITSGGVSQNYKYDAVGNITGIIDALGNHTEFILDEWGRIIGVEKADGSKESYRYDLAGNMLRSEDGLGNTINYHYDCQSNITERIDQLGNRDKYHYDRENRLIQLTDRNSNITKLSYNMYGSIMIRQAVSSDGNRSISESFGYFPDGKLRFAISDGMRYDYSYDNMGRLEKKSASGRTLISNKYDLNGNRIGVCDITGKTTQYHYDSLDRLCEVCDQGKQLMRYEYNPDGTLSRMEAGNGIFTEYTYDIDKNMISQKMVVSGLGHQQLADPNHLSNEKSYQSLQANMQSTILIDNHYSYDKKGNLSDKQTLSGLTSYMYDCNDRVIHAQYPTGSESFTYDKAGNRVERLWQGKQNNQLLHEQYQYDAGNRLVKQDIQSFIMNDFSISNIDTISSVTNQDTDLFSIVKKQMVSHETPSQTSTKEFTYDKQGNMLSDGKLQFSYDPINRLSEVKEASTGTVLTRNRYDGEGLRAELEENGKLVKFLYDQDKVIAETDTQESHIRYIRGLELISSDCEKAKTYYHYASDELGSITHVLGEDGQILNHYEYDAFGNFTLKEESVENRFGFAGEQFDPATELYYLRARFYNPVIGRFIQEDTYYGDGLNLYTYCHNNPVGYVDPSGHDGICPEHAAALEKLKEQGMTPEQAEAKYQELKNQGLTPEQALAKLSEGGTETETLYHYTNEKGMDGIIDSQKLNPSLKANNPKDARYGDGQYLSDLVPDSYTPAQLAKKFINVPNKYKYTHYVEIDVSGLNIVQGRNGVFVVPNSSPLNLTGRIVSTGKVGTK